MRKKLQALLVVLLLAPCPASASGTVTLGLLRPEVFTRNTGAPVPEVRSFTVPSASGSFTLRVSSGSPEGGERVSAAVILVNGATVVEASDLNQRVTELERPLAGLVPGVNRISVEVRSIPSSFLSVSIAAEYALDVAITEPLPGAALPRGLNLVRGWFLSYTGDAGIAVNGVPAALSGGEFVASGVPLAAGTNTLTAVITTISQG